MASMQNAMTIDVEDYFQVAALARWAPTSNWDDFDLRVEQNTDRILQLFDQHGIKATFFVLGWIADKCPALVQKIVAEGHELACHGYSHQLIYNQTPEV
ncbi:MAG: polysaccharide deacetylase family protein, partial [Pseudomonadales bacterium]|nr:polysaccharide deacetylase family protein [Pseudomonadales bacterium]